MPCSCEGYPPSPYVNPGSVECEERIKELEKEIETVIYQVIKFLDNKLMHYMRTGS